MLLNVKLFVTALFNVIPFVSASCNAIVDVVGSVALLLEMRNLFRHLLLHLMNY